MSRHERERPNFAGCGFCLPPPSVGTRIIHKTRGVGRASRAAGRSSRTRFRPAQTRTVAASWIGLGGPTNTLRELDPAYVNHPRESPSLVANNLGLEVRVGQFLVAVWLPRGIVHAR